MASRVSKLMLKPAASINAAEPTIDSGIVTSGMATARNDPSDRKTTSTTMPTASASVRDTSSIEDWI